MDMVPKRLYAALAAVVVIAAATAWVIATYLGEAKSIALLLLLLAAEGVVPGLIDKSHPRLRKGAWLVMVVVVGATYLMTVFVF
jgi:hypothetical protein